MRTYNAFQAFVLAFFSKSLYRDVGQRWRGIGLGYLILLLALSWIPIVVKVHFGFSSFVEKDAAQFLQEFPTISIRNGKVSIVLDTLKQVFSVPVPLWWLVCFGISMAYLAFGVSANSQPPEAAAELVALAPTDASWQPPQP